MTDAVMTETMATIPGFNVETMEGFAAFAAENPNDVELGVEATAIWTGHAGHTTAKIGPWMLADQRIDKDVRSYSLQMGAWKEVEAAIGVEGPADNVEPIEVALAAMSSCVSWAICINAALQGISFDGLQVSAKAKIDPRVLLGNYTIEEASSAIKSIALDIDVRGENLTEEDQQRIAQMAHRSPVHAMIRYANTLDTTVTVK